MAGELSEPNLTYLGKYSYGARSPFNSSQMEAIDTYLFIRHGALLLPFDATALALHGYLEE